MLLGGIDFDFLKNNKRVSVLDYGCENGQYSIFLLKNGYKVVGIDINPESEKKVRSKLTIKENKRFSFYCLNAEKDVLSLGEKFDCVLCRETLEHVKNYEKLIREFYFMLKIDGYLLISVPTFFTEKYFRFWDSLWLKKCGHVNVFKKNQLLKLARKYRFYPAKIDKHSFRRTLFWSMVTPFKIDHDMGKILNYKKLAKIALFISDCFCYFRFVEKIGNKVLPKSYVFYLKKKSDEI
ncbi:class I SAM-dependent methyltransferase [Candidatus Dependentiae bacterium]